MGCLIYTVYPHKANARVLREQHAGRLRPPPFTRRPSPVMRGCGSTSRADCHFMPVNDCARE